MKMEWIVAGENVVDSVFRPVFIQNLENWLKMFCICLVHGNFNAKPDLYHGHFAM